MEKSCGYLTPTNSAKCFLNSRLSKLEKIFLLFGAAERFAIWFAAINSFGEIKLWAFPTSSWPSILVSNTFLSVVQVSSDRLYFVLIELLKVTCVLGDGKSVGRKRYLLLTWLLLTVARGIVV